MITIQGDRITLRTMTREELHAGKKLYVADPIMDPNPYVYDAEKVDALYERHQQEQDFYLRLGIFQPDGQIIGELSIKRIDREKSRCELGIMLYQDRFKEKGLGSEAFALARDYAFDALHLDNIYADTMGSNVRMQRILSKLGFRCFLRLEDCYDMHDRWEDRLDYVIRREEVRPLMPEEYPTALAFAREHFERHIEPISDSLFDRIGGQPEAIFGYFARGELQGVLTLQNGHELRLLFVKTGCHRKGIGRKLLDEAIEAALRQGETELTVHAILSAVPAYERMGFAATGEPQCLGKLWYQPMALDITP